MCNILRLPTQASDSNLGTESLPLKTISRAATVVMESGRGGIGTKVLVYPGVYRESVKVDSQGTAPIVFEAKEKGKAIISGSEVWTGWQQQGSSNLLNPRVTAEGETPQV